MCYIVASVVCSRNAAKWTLFHRHVMSTHVGGRLMCVGRMYLFDRRARTHVFWRFRNGQFTGRWRSGFRTKREKISCPPYRIRGSQCYNDNMCELITDIKRIRQAIAWDDTGVRVPLHTHTHTHISSWSRYTIATCGGLARWDLDWWAVVLQLNAVCTSHYVLISRTLDSLLGLGSLARPSVDVRIARIMYVLLYTYT